ncbi:MULTISPECIES: hypothetical protein [Bradyrhizobium]|jgi:hypothetical protein|nr:MULTISPECIES: hypothetical protein [Bradyrhizobium]
MTYVMKPLSCDPSRIRGMSDEVHYRFVYDQDGTLRSYSMGERSI